MDKSLYNASGCKDRTAHDAICAADRTRTLVYRASRTKKRMRKQNCLRRWSKDLQKDLGSNSVTESNSRILRLERNMCEVEHGYRKTIRCYEQKRC